MVWPEARFIKGEADARPARATRVAVKTGMLLASMLRESLGMKNGIGSPRHGQLSAHYIYLILLLSAIRFPGAKLSLPADQGGAVAVTTQ